MTNTMERRESFIQKNRAFLLQGHAQIVQTVSRKNRIQCITSDTVHQDYLPKALHVFFSNAPKSSKNCRLHPVLHTLPTSVHTVVADNDGAPPPRACP